MTRKRSRRKPAPVLELEAPTDYRTLPPQVDLSRAVETYDVDAATHEIPSPFATPDIADMARTGAIGGGF